MTVAADTSFLKKSASWQKHWGVNRRAEWATVVTAPVLLLDSPPISRSDTATAFVLDTALRGFKFLEKGGGNESKTLHFRNANGKEYTVRSINKSRNDVIPPGFEKTFVEDIIRDGVSCSYPYGAFPITVMQEKAGLYFSIPTLVYLPEQPALDTFNKRFANGLYMVEQRPSGNWEESANLGHFNQFISTENLVNKLQEDNRYRVAQYDFAKARLFDMLINDWDRHEGNWRWGTRETGDDKLYLPIARDRDQAFYTHNGAWLDRLLPAGGFSYMQHFDHKAGDPISFSVAAKHMDRFFTSGLDLDDWVNAAKELQSSLTDAVITASVQRLPPEIYAVSGKELTDKLISRRSQLVELATTYYLSIAKEVEIVGSKSNEYFEIGSGDSGSVKVSVYPTNRHFPKPVYERSFKPSETNEIRIFGVGGEDVYKINIPSSPIVVRIIGGPQHDSITQTGKRVHIYDNSDNTFSLGAASRHLSNDSAIHLYKYGTYEKNTKGIAPSGGYSYADRIYVGLKYSFKHYRWRREPFATKQSIGINYSIQQHAISANYAALYPNVLGRWGLFIDANFDAVRWTNFFGIGNETTTIITKRNGYHRTLSREWLANTGLRLESGKNIFEFAVFYQQVKIKKDTGSYVAKTFLGSYEDQLAPNDYGGAWLSYKYASVNDAIVPTKGFTAFLKAVFDQNFTQEEFFQHYTARLQGWLPLSKKFSLSITAGGSAVNGGESLLNSARIYEHAVIGGTKTLRGYRMERFWGKTAFYNNNELRFITNLRTHLLNAKFGLIAFFDDGRVWVPGENSNTIHTSYGGGILLAPFGKISVTVTYGISDETKNVQFRVNKLF